MKLDVQVEGSGTLFVFIPFTDEAKEWIEEHVSKEGFQPDWPKLYVEHRYMSDLVEGMREEGLKVMVS